MTTFLLTLIALGMIGVLILLYQIFLQLEAQVTLLTKVRDLQLNPRTRMSTIQVQSGPISDDQEAHRVGRATAARRVVVGGEEESELNQNLHRQYSGGEDE